jgi:hypothetical protein
MGYELAMHVGRIHDINKNETFVEVFNEKADKDEWVAVYNEGDQKIAYTSNDVKVVLTEKDLEKARQAIYIPSTWTFELGKQGENPILEAARKSKRRGVLIFDGNTYITEDLYGDVLALITIEEAIEALEKTIIEHDCGAYIKIAHRCLKEIQLSIQGFPGHLMVAFYGH